MEVIKQIKSIDMLGILKKTGAILDGHFKLTSGYHSKYYLQCARLLQYPGITYNIIEEALNEYRNDMPGDEIDTVVSPAIGGILFGYMIAFKLKKNMVFTERTGKNMELKRGFELKPGSNVLIAEDVITTGGSVFEVIDVCRKFNCNIKGVICIVDRSENIEFNYPFFSLIKINIDKYSPGSCPLCKSGIDFYYPGSRK